MTKTRKELYLNSDSIEYIEKFGPRSQSKIVEEAIELHKNKDKAITPKIPKYEVKIIG